MTIPTSEALDRCPDSSIASQSAKSDMLKSFTQISLYLFVVILVISGSIFGDDCDE